MILIVLLCGVTIISPTSLGYAAEPTMVLAEPIEVPCEPLTGAEEPAILHGRTPWCLNPLRLRMLLPASQQSKTPSGGPHPGVGDMGKSVSPHVLFCVWRE
jgi:hypothetical protein